VVLQGEAARTAAHSNRTQSRTAARGTGRQAGKHAARGGEQERDKVWGGSGAICGIGWKNNSCGPQLTLNAYKLEQI
jgi:hypothetical protein